MPKRLISVLWIVMLALSSCTLTSQPTQNRLPTPTGVVSARPVVTITSPQNNSEGILNQQLLVSASASDSIGITQLQFLANGRIVRTLPSDSPTGSQTMTAVFDYTPREAGTLNLAVVAYRAAIASDPATVTINVRSNQPAATATTNQPPPPIVPPINPNDPTCRALTNTGLNVRSGPSTAYARISTVAAGTVVPIVGRNADNSWWQVRIGVTIGWVTNDFVTIYGICTNIPVIQPPPLPTNTPPPVLPTVPIFPTFTLPPVPTATAGLADLVVTNVSGSTSLTLLEGGVNSTYSVTITNTGLGPTAQFNNVITLLPTNETVPLGVVANLRPGESIILNAGITFRATGSYTLQVRADSDNQITEQSEVNNTGILTVNVIGAQPR